MAPTRKPSAVLGISTGHGDSSAALVIDGCLVAAAEEERFTRIKHYALFPHQAVAYCLKHAGIRPEDVTTVAIARQPLASFWKKVSTWLRHPGLANHQGNARHESGSLNADLRKAGLSRARMKKVEHHVAHLMSARYLIPGESPALLSLDGMGDFVSTAFGRSTAEGVEILGRVHFPHSLGYFYTAMTQYLGFLHYGDEFKVMGLSSYGKPRYAHAMRELVREREDLGFELNLEAFPILANPIKFSIEKGQPKIAPFFSTSFLTQVIGIPPRKKTDPLTEAHWDLAKSVQVRFEEIGNLLLTQLHDRVGGTSVAIAGGCAHNSVWVGKIPSSTPFRQVAIAPAAHDAGIAVGAAAAMSEGEVIPEGKHWALLGPMPEESSPVDDVPETITQETFLSENALAQWMAQKLADGKVIGLMQGRMELGPRALGNRSILADPRPADMRDRLNERVKHRETFRPFAASVLVEHQAPWFKNSFDSPTMEAVFEVQNGQRSKISGVVHVDNTCRIQSVHKETQPLFWEIIEAFRQRTGIPMLINTSFNDAEPIVCSERDALKCFLGTDLDYLVVGLKVFSKSGAIALTA